MYPLGTVVREPYLALLNIKYPVYHEPFVDHLILFISLLILLVGPWWQQARLHYAQPGIPAGGFPDVSKPRYNLFSGSWVSSRVSTQWMSLIQLYRPAGILVRYPNQLSIWRISNLRLSQSRNFISATLLYYSVIIHSKGKQTDNLEPMCS